MAAFPGIPRPVTTKVKPPLGWPRETDSLCPVCVRETRQEILDGKKDYKILLNEKVGEIKAQIIEREGKIMMVKECPEHGLFEDVMAIVEKERPNGVIVQFGGQTPLKLALALERAGVPIIGTQPDSIDLAEDRERFRELLEQLKLKLYH